MTSSDVSDITKAPEMLGGRVKTLHPAVHGGILAQTSKASDQKDLEAQGIAPIDIVVCNLYPFEDTIAKDPAPTIAQAVEEVDIGGVTLLRAAAKNHERVYVLSDPKDYASFLQQYGTGNQDQAQALRNKLALKAFSQTAHYDTAISDYFRKQHASKDPFVQQLTLRYGANPHQKPAQAFVTEGEMPVKGEWAMEAAPDELLILLSIVSPLRLSGLHQPARCTQRLGPCQRASYRYWPSSSHILQARLARWRGSRCPIEPDRGESLFRR